jgi:ATP-dependent RNA helicase DDX46/PRP5
MDDADDTKRTLVALDDMPAVDMSITDAAVGDLEGDEDEEEANKLDAALRDDTQVEEIEVDPLDAFMSDVNVEVKKVNAADMQRTGAPGRSRIRLDDASGEAVPDEAPAGTEEPDEIDTTELNPEDILALAAKRAKKKDLATIDHSRVTYEPFRKEFYVPPPEIAEMTDDDAELVRLELDSIKIRGVDCPRPVTKWSHFGMPASWLVLITVVIGILIDLFVSLEVIKKLNFAAPTPIQAQAVPAIMSGRDVIGVAKTGSGKTIAFLLPMFRHIKDQRPLEQMEGPIAVIMTPTRELAVQIHKECKLFLKVLNLRVRYSHLHNGATLMYMSVRLFAPMVAPQSRTRSRK